ncbi:MAG: DUF455 family protein, partial [Planctomycetota bacterium]
AAPLRLNGPGRAATIEVRDRADRVPKAAALREASARARLLHVFLHHEVQAAELSAWAVLAFPDTPVEFRRGLFKILDDEVRHAALYAERLDALGVRYGDHAVRDWFWQRTLGCETPVQYLALMGLGFEGGNLEHAQRFEAQLADAGDPESARLVARIGREEVAHVRFASTWFSRWTGRDPEEGPSFEDWAEALPPPLTPAVLRHLPLDRERRRRAGLSADFLDHLERCAPTTSRSGRGG